MRGEPEAIVIGGGPAGSTAALLLARRGWNVMLLDRGPAGRTKTCGGCLSARGVTLLRTHGLDDVLDEASARRMTRTAGLHLPGRPMLRVPLGGVYVDRRRFDRRLLDHARAAGVTVRQPAHATSIEVQPDGVVVHVDRGGQQHALRASLLVGADGLRSAVARAAGLAQRAQIGRKYGFAYDLRIEPDRLPEDSVEMFVGTQGYVGVVRAGHDRAHVAGLVGQGVGARQPIGFVSALMDLHPGLAAIHPRVHRQEVEHLCAAGPMPWRPSTVASGRVVLVGDAAGYVEPFTGEGMTWALAGAALLAETAPRRANAWTSAHARSFATAWRRGLAASQRRCAMVATVLERHTLRAAAGHVIGRHRRLAARLAARIVPA